MTRLLVAALALGALLACCASGGTSLTGHTWQWTASTTTTPVSQSVVPDPQKYTIEFKANQTFSAKADCNQVSGTLGQHGRERSRYHGRSVHARCVRARLAVRPVHRESGQGQRVCPRHVPADHELSFGPASAR